MVIFFNLPVISSESKVDISPSGYLYWEFGVYKEMQEDRDAAFDQAEHKGALAGTTQVAQQKELSDNGFGGDEQSPNEQ